MYSYWLEQIEVLVEKMSLNNNQNTPYFSFNWLTEYTHDYIVVPRNLDVSLTNSMKKLNSKGFLNNTIVVFVTDHGNKLTSYSFTEHGKKERVLPLLSIKLPRHLVSSLHYTNFVNNKNKLISFSDVYQTLRHFLFLNKHELNAKNASCTNLFATNSKDIRQLRGISLLMEVPSTRFCSDAYISDSYCSCLNSIKLNETAFMQETQHSFNSICMKTLDYIRNITQNIRPKCVPYSVSSIGEFKKTFYSSTKVIYSGQILLQPGDALFQLDLKMNNHELQFNDLPIRLSKYGNQSSCIFDRDLQNYCFCK